MSKWELVEDGAIKPTRGTKVQKDTSGGMSKCQNS